jgi:LmbE family N-acetylglucosaminyl deacetylase
MPYIRKGNILIMRKISFLFFIVLISLTGLGQLPVTYSSSQVFQKIKKLNVLGSVLYIAAHPDDENTRLLSWLANDRLYRTGYLSITRGDGGQNLIGNEQGVELGLIRTQELLAARRIDGAEQFFTRGYDFGFSKSPEEAFKFWDRQKILSDVVWVIRKFRPDVIITRFPTTGEGGHGHHTASAILAEEAFTLAADPKSFPEQFKYGVTTWQCKRLLWNTFNFGSTNTTNESQFKIDAGGYNTLLGKSYGEIAAESRSQHKSQGFGVPRSRGTQPEYFKTIKGDAPVNDLMDGIKTGWDSSNDAGIQSMIDLLIKNYSFEHPESSVPGLVKLYTAIQLTKDDFWKTQKLADITDLIQAAGGLYIEATTTQPYVVQGDTLKIAVTVNNRGGLQMSQPEAIFKDMHYAIPDSLKVNVNAAKNIAVLINDSITQPYWLKEPLQKGSFDVSDQTLIGKPINDPFSIDFNITIDGEKFVFTKPIQYKSNDPVKGELYQPLVVLPRLEVKYFDNNIVSVNSKAVPAQVSITSNTSVKSDIAIVQHLPKNISTNNSNATYSLDLNNPVSVNQVLQPTGDALNHREQIAFMATGNGINYDRYSKSIKYDHIPAITYFPKATANIVTADIKITGKKIGYIAGAGDKVAEAIQQMGYTLTMLQEKDITDQNLKQFDAIVTGVRAYNVDSWLNTAYTILMAYVNNGGTLVVQYNTNNNNGPVKAKIFPYGFTISRNRVSEEDAQVKFINPDDPLLKFPNKITAADFDGWVQERSIYNAEQLDPKFRSVLAMHDANEAEQSGSLIAADYGKGKLIYTGLVFYRELPAGVPGAYRLLANILSAGKRSMPKKN